MIRLALLLIAVVLPAAAQDVERDLPALHEVTGVASDDVLNVRAGPSASAPTLFTLAPGQREVEVVRVAQDGSGRDWGLVSGGERSGWASMRFLSRTTPEDLPWLPSLMCFGTEPFWSFALDRTNDALFEGMGGDADAVRLASRTRSRNDRRAFSFTGAGAFGPASGVVRREQCGDGMSDREFGFAIDLMMSTPGGTDHVSGCCRVMP